MGLMIWYVIAALGVLLYFIGEGTTEGFTFASQQRRKNNKIIRDAHADKQSKGFLSYHVYRVCFENLGMVMTIVSAFFIRINIFAFTWFMLGWMGVGIFIYERMFNWVSYGIPFPKKSDYDLGEHINFRRTWKLDFWILGIGIILIVTYFVFMI